MRKTQGRLAYAASSNETPDLTADDLRHALVPEVPKESHTGGLGGLMGWRRANRGGHEETAPAVAPEAAEAGTVVPETIEAGTSEMIDEIFEPLKPVQEKLSELAERLEPITRVRPLTEAFGPIRVFKDKLASAVEPIRKLEREFEQLADVFEPIRLLRDELTGITGAFAGKIAELTQALEPLGKLREELTALTVALEPASELYEDFTKLSGVITPTAHENGADTHETSDARHNGTVA
jgi:hypothetical protein